jgi:hypothetical protein
MEGLMVELGAMFVIGLTLFAIVALVVVTTVLHAVGKAFNVGNYGWGICLLVVILSIVAGGLIAAIASSIHLALGVLGSLFVHTALVATLMQTPMVAAFVITLVSQLVQVVLLFGAGLILSVLVGASMGELMSRGQVVGSSTQTISNGDGSSVRTVTTTNAQGEQTTVVTTKDAQGNVVIRTSADGVASTEIQSDALESEPAGRTPTNARERFAYLDTLPEVLGQKIGREARITLRDGREHQGTIRGVSVGAIELEKRVSGGKMLFPIKLGTIRSALVKEQVEE